MLERVPGALFNITSSGRDVSSGLHLKIGPGIPMVAASTSIAPCEASTSRIKDPGYSVLVAALNASCRAFNHSFAILFSHYSYGVVGVTKQLDMWIWPGIK